MRPALILLALLVAGCGRGDGADLLARQTPHEIVAGADRAGATLGSPASPVAPVATTLARVPADGIGPAPRSSTHRVGLPDTTSRLRPEVPGRQMAFEARRAHYRRYAGAIALARAGVHAFHTSTPPPFPLV